MTLNPTATVMLIGDVEHFRVASSQAFDMAGFQVQIFERAEQALERLDADHSGAVISDSVCRG